MLLVSNEETMDTDWSTMIEVRHRTWRNAIYSKPDCFYAIEVLGYTLTAHLQQVAGGQIRPRRGGRTLSDTSHHVEGGSRCRMSGRVDDPRKAAVPSILS